MARCKASSACSSSPATAKAQPALYRIASSSGANAIARLALSFARSVSPNLATLQRLKHTHAHHQGEGPSACDSTLILAGKPSELRSIPEVALTPELPNKLLGNHPGAPIALVGTDEAISRDRRF